MREILVMTSVYACYPVHPPVQTVGVGEGRFSSGRDREVQDIQLALILTKS